MRDSTALVLGSLIFVVVFVVAFLGSGGQPQTVTDEQSKPGELPKIHPPKIPDPVLKKQTEERPPVPETWGDLAFDGPAGKLVDEYKDNRIAADAKYKDRRVRVSMRVDAIGRTGDGTAYLGTTHVGNAVASEPNLFANFLEANAGAVAGLKRGDNVTLEGFCRGRFEDGIFRQIEGYEFVVRLGGYRIVTP